MIIKQGLGMNLTSATSKKPKRMTSLAQSNLEHRIILHYDNSGHIGYPELYDTHHHLVLNLLLSLFKYLEKIIKRLEKKTKISKKLIGKSYNIFRNDEKVVKKVFKYEFNTFKMAD